MRHVFDILKFASPESVASQDAGGTGGGGDAALPLPHPKRNFKRHRFCRHVNVKLLFALPSARNQLL